MLDFLNSGDREDIVVGGEIVGKQRTLKDSASQRDLAGSAVKDECLYPHDETYKAPARPPKRGPGTVLNGKRPASIGGAQRKILVGISLLWVVGSILGIGAIIAAFSEAGIMHELSLFLKELLG